MRTIELDLGKMTSLPALHAYLHRALALPAYYGKNLDALYDCLTDISEATTIIMPQAVDEEKHFGWYGTQLLTVFVDAAAANRNLTIIIKPKETENNS